MPNDQPISARSGYLPLTLALGLILLSPLLFMFLHPESLIQRSMIAVIGGAPAKNAQLAKA